MPDKQQRWRVVFQDRETGEYFAEIAVAFDAFEAEQIARRNLKDDPMISKEALRALELKEVRQLTEYDAPRHVPPSVGRRPRKAQKIMDRVYERSRREGYPKARAAKIGWGAVHRAGYDPDHLADLIADITALRQNMIERDRWIDKRYGALEPEYGEMAARGEYDTDSPQEYQLLRRHVRGHVKPMEEAQRELMDPIARQIRGSSSRIFRTGLGVARGGVRFGRRVAGIRRPTLRLRKPTPRPTARPLRPQPTTAVRPPPRGMYADPARLPVPDDYAGYDNLNLLRIVEAATKKGYHPVKRLMEGQIVLPAHQWDRVHAQVKEWPDIAVTDEDKDGQPDRIIRRGHDNYQTNLFIDRA